MIVRFIKEYHRLNHKVVRKPYPLPRMDKMMQKLKGFYYAITLYPNMGYYAIRPSPTRQYMTTIVTEFC